MEAWVEESMDQLFLLTNSSDNGTGDGNFTHHTPSTFLNKWTFNETIPVCPKTPSHTLEQLGYPTTSIIYVVFAATCLVFAAVIAFKYNSVKIFNRNIRTQNISNTMWVIYYLTVGLRASCGAVMYGINRPQPDQSKHSETIHELLFVAACILSSINAFTLSLSLNHQRRFRSSAPPTPPPQQTPGGATTKEGDPLIVKSDVLRKSVTPAEVIFFVLFIINLSFLYVALKEQKINPIFIFIFVCTYIVQRIPILVLSFIIVTNRNGNEGPTRQSKAYLLFSCLLHLSNDLPVFFWAQILPNQCIIMNSLSYIDVLTIINFTSLVLFFLFLRSEYLRNMEECIWTTVSQIQDTFDFRRF